MNAAAMKLHNLQRRPVLFHRPLVNDIGDGGHAPHAFRPGLAHEHGGDGLLLVCLSHHRSGTPHNRNVRSRFMGSG